jgi:hypothetical protein
MYKEMKKIVEVGNKHRNGDEFPDFLSIYFFFGIKNVRVGGKILGSVGRSETHIYFFLALYTYSQFIVAILCPAMKMVYSTKETIISSCHAMFIDL